MKIGFCVSGGGRVVESILAARRAGILTFSGAEGLVDRVNRFEEVAVRHSIALKRIYRADFPNKELFREALGNAIENLDVDALFLTFDWILPANVVRKFEGRIINLHMSLLPLFPGRGAIGTALASGMKFGGVTYHVVDEGMDTGPIVAQATVPIVTSMTSDELGRAAFRRAVPLGIQVVRWLERGDIAAKFADGFNANAGCVDGGPFSPPVDGDILEFAQEFLGRLGIV